MERQKTTTQVKHLDAFSQALIQSTASYLGEEGIPTLEKPATEESTEKKDPKANAHAADPAVVLSNNLRTGTGIKQSHGATIKYTNVVAKEEVHKEKEEKCEKKNKEEKMKESFNLYVEGVHYVFEKAKGLDGKACWKGYKLAGTKQKGGKTVDNCVKAGYEPFGELILDEKTSSSDTYGHMVNYIEEKNGLYANIHAKRKRGGAPAKPGHEDYPAKDAFKKAAKTAKKEEYDVDTANQLWSEVAEKLEQLGEMDGSKFKVIGEKKLDPVGKEDGDIDNDGDKDKSDSYLHARRKKITNIIAKSKGKK